MRVIGHFFYKTLQENKIELVEFLSDLGGEKFFFPVTPAVELTCDVDR